MCIYLVKIVLVERVDKTVGLKLVYGPEQAIHIPQLLKAGLALVVFIQVACNPAQPSPVGELVSSVSKYIIYDLPIQAIHLTLE